MKIEAMYRALRIVHVKIWRKEFLHLCDWGRNFDLIVHPVWHKQIGKNIKAGLLASVFPMSRFR